MTHAISKSTPENRMVVGDTYPIQPNHIDCENGDRNQAYRLGALIVKFCQIMGHWVPFTEQGIISLLNQDERISEIDIAEYLEFIESQGEIVRHNDPTSWNNAQQYVVTHQFVADLFLHYPAK